MEEIKELEGGAVTSPQGFLAGATYAGLKTYGETKLDLGILLSEAPCEAAATFTTSRIKAAPLLVTRKHMAAAKPRALVANSGCANAFVGEQGLIDAEETATLAAKKLGLRPEEVLVSSTGMIGVELPMALIRSGIPKVRMSRDGGHELARAIMTTDTRPKEIAVSFPIDRQEVTLGAIAKGAGMIHPNMATMLAFITTDAAVEAAWLDQVLKKAVDTTFNMITVDGDTSPNDTVLLLANGAAGNAPLQDRTAGAQAFEKALSTVCAYLARAIVEDGEGATKLIEVTVDGAKSVREARTAAKTIASSTLVKTAVHGNDPNWGRVVAALARSGARVDEGKLALYINGICLMEGGKPIPFFRDAVVASMAASREIRIDIALNLGGGKATAWGCDLTEEYVRFNSAYTT